MSRRNLFALETENSVVVGTGLIALDVVIDADKNGDPWLWAGGTCGNLMAILSYLGWQAFPVCRLNNDAASRCVEDDLHRWGVRLDFAKLSPGSRTPIIVQRIAKTSSGLPFHRFSWTCPNCGSWLPGYRPVPASVTGNVLSQLESPKVFFLDRVSRAALILAKAFAERGALIFFEPSGVGEPRLFREAYSLAHILKYSHERVKLLQNMGGGTGPPLEIETLGAEGLRYRSRISGARSDGWERLEAYEVVDLRDAAGAGDWCSAGIIHRLGQLGSGGFLRARSPQVEEALRLGQALASWNCGFPGARGGMYSVDKRTFRLQVQRIISSDGSKEPKPEIPSLPVRRAFECICPRCIERNGKNLHRVVKDSASSEAPYTVNKGMVACEP
jgi:sugar/nucleoside kinase (ribokinase family)